MNADIINSALVVYMSSQDRDEAIMNGSVGNCNHPLNPDILIEVRSFNSNKPPAEVVRLHPLEGKEFSRYGRIILGAAELTEEEKLIIYLTNETLGNNIGTRVFLKIRRQEFEGRATDQLDVMKTGWLGSGVQVVLEEPTI